jgi:hypothetical protein
MSNAVSGSTMLRRWASVSGTRVSLASGASPETSDAAPWSSTILSAALSSSRLMSELKLVGRSSPSLTDPWVAAVPLPLANMLSRPLASPLPEVAYEFSPMSTVQPILPIGIRAMEIV